MSKKSRSVSSPSDSDKSFIFILIALIAAIVIGFGIFIGVQSAKGNTWGKPEEKPIDNIKVSYTAEGDGQGEYATFYTSEDAKYVVSIFTDPRCPVCSQFEKEHSKTISDLVSRGDTAIRVHMMTFLDDNTQSDYSKMVSSAFKILVDKDEPQVAWNFYTEMWKNQPAEYVAQENLPTKEDIAKSAKAMGANDDTASAIENMDIHSADSANKENIDALTATTGSVGTPSVFINGFYQPNALNPQFFDEITNNNVPEDAQLANINAQKLLKSGQDGKLNGSGQNTPQSK